MACAIIPKIEYSEDQKIPNCCTLIIHAEDHTLGNILRSQLLQDPQVLFAAYRVKHPLDNTLIMKIQTTAETTPLKALHNAIVSLNDTIGKLEKSFQKHDEEKKQL